MKEKIVVVFTLMCPKCHKISKIKTRGKWEAIKRLREKGYTYRKIMEITGIKSTDTINYYLKK